VRGPGRTRSPVMGLLKERTGPVHRRVEDKLGLLNPDLTIERLKAVLARFFGFWETNEIQIGAWSVDHPSASAQFRCTDRRRAALFADDLLALGMTTGELGRVPGAPAIFDGLNHSKVLGWLYVTEGSTLGGAIITRHLRRVGALTDFALHSFRPYGEGLGAMWRDYTSTLDRFVSDNPVRTEAVVEAALRTFDALERWLEPLSVSASG
jgi:heme oxygenase (biliverdin-IX-beta and delta-forming)